MCTSSCGGWLRTPAPLPLLPRGRRLGSADVAGGVGPGAILWAAAGGERWLEGA